jgi:hypothetical protein
VIRGLVPAAATAALTIGFGLFAGVAPATALQQASPTTSVTIIVPITVPTPEAGILDATTLETYTAPGGMLQRELEQVINRPVTLAIDPMIIASIRLLGSAAPDSALRWLRLLEGANNETFALQWADADVTAAIHAGSSRTIAPTGLDFAIDPSRFSDVLAEPTSTPDPEATANTEPAAGEPPLPSTASLLAFPYSLTGIVWPVNGSVASDDIAVLQSSGFDTILLSSSNVSVRSDGVVARLGSSKGIVIDEAASAKFGEVVTSNRGSEAIADELSRHGATHTVIALDRSVSWTESNLGRVINETFTESSLVPLGIGELSRSSAHSASLIEPTPNADRLRSTKALLGLERLDAKFATIAARPELITQKRTVELLSALSSRWAASEELQSTAAASFTKASMTLRSSVKIVKSSSIFLLADRTTVPVVVGNELDQDVTVYITVRPSTPLLSVDESRVKLEIAPDSQRKALIPVKSISNGVVDLRIDLTRPDSATIGNSTHVRITVQAGWETPVTFVIAGIVLAVFILGFYRTLAKRRRERAANAD